MLRASPILTAAQVRDAEARAIAAGTSVELLMERAGCGLAEAVWRYAGAQPVLVLCGPGNNGGDGYVAARLLRDRGVDVRVAALGGVKAGAAAAARAAWDGTVETVGNAGPAPVLLDALFGTGLSRGLDDGLATALNRLAGQANVAVAVDLPSGVDTDTGALLGEVPRFDITVTFGAKKPAHLLQPAADRCGRVATVEIGVDARSETVELGRPQLPWPGPEDHKYTRGLVAVVGGPMAGAAELAVLGAAHAGAGYVVLLAPEPCHTAPHAIVRRAIAALPEMLADPRTGAIVVGPGLGRADDARWALDRALASGKPLVIDGDALHLLGSRSFTGPMVLTPHEGEFRSAFPDLGQPSKIERARAAATRCGAVIVYKGADTVIAAPDGRAAVAALGSPWLSTAGTGDVLAGAIGAMLARGLAPFEAAQAGVWLHGEAARGLGPGFVADDLARALPAAL